MYLAEEIKGEPELGMNPEIKGGVQDVFYSFTSRNTQPLPKLVLRTGWTSMNVLERVKKGSSGPTLLNLLSLRHGS